MRISGDQRDRDYWRNKLARCPQVSLDGTLMKHVVEADDKLGHVIVEIWKDGKPELEAAGTRISRRTLTGTVVISAPDAEVT